MNTFGRLFRVTTFGESHGPALGCVIDGCPAGLSLCEGDIARELERRRPGAGGPAATARSEEDRPEILSGVFEGKTLGTPIAVIIRNNNQMSSDYDELKDLYRPGHADWTWEAKYGIRDHRGGGRSSGRETAGRVAAGAVAKTLLAGYGISVRAWAQALAGIAAPEPGDAGFDLDEAERNPLCVPCAYTADRIAAELEALRSRGDSAGGIVSCRVTGMVPGLGEPVFDKLPALLGRAILSIGACKGIEFGAGFAAADKTGSENNDEPALSPYQAQSPVKPDAAQPGTPGPADRNEPPACPPFKTNRAGGTLGGISNGMNLEFRAAFKPAASIAAEQSTVDRNGAARKLTVRGRHDICVVPRAVPVVEAMTALVLIDAIAANAQRLRL